LNALAATPGMASQALNAISGHQYGSGPGKITQVAILGPGATIEVGPINMRGIQYRGLGPCNLSHLRFAVNLVASKRIKLAPLVNSYPGGNGKSARSYRNNRQQGKYGAINPAQVIISH